MNALNSILLEGTITETKYDSTDPEMMFKIMSKRFHKAPEGDGEILCNVLRTNVVCYGKMAENMSRVLAIGIGVRVVGRLTDYPGLGVSIYAEHIEIKPVSAKNLEV